MEKQEAIGLDWCFLDGFAHRGKQFGLISANAFIVYTVALD